MALFNFFNRTKHRKFDYIPRFYNPEKEELENRLNKYQKKERNSLEDTKMNIQAGLRSRAPRSGGGFNLRYSLMIMLIIVILLGLSIYLFSAFFPRFMEVFGEM